MLYDAFLHLSHGGAPATCRIYLTFNLKTEKKGKKKRVAETEKKGEKKRVAENVRQLLRSQPSRNIEHVERLGAGWHLASDLPER